jgi:hypothetical protein
MASRAQYAAVAPAPADPGKFAAAEVAVEHRLRQIRAELERDRLAREAAEHARGTIESEEAELDRKLAELEVARAATLGVAGARADSGDVGVRGVAPYLQPHDSTGGGGGGGGGGNRRRAPRSDEEPVAVTRGAQRRTDLEPELPPAPGPAPAPEQAGGAGTADTAEFVVAVDETAAMLPVGGHTPSDTPQRTELKIKTAKRCDGLTTRGRRRCCCLAAVSAVVVALLLAALCGLVVAAVMAGDRDDAVPSGQPPPSATTPSPWAAATAAASASDGDPDAPCGAWSAQPELCAGFDRRAPLPRGGPHWRGLTTAQCQAQCRRRADTNNTEGCCMRWIIADSASGPGAAAGATGTGGGGSGGGGSACLWIPHSTGVVDPAPNNGDYVSSRTAFCNGE